TASWVGRGPFLLGGFLGLGQQFLAENRDFTRRLDAQPNLAPVNIDDSDADIIADIDFFTQFAAQYQHVAFLLRARRRYMITAQLGPTPPVWEGDHAFFCGGNRAPCPRLPHGW